MSADDEEALTWEGDEPVAPRPGRAKAVAPEPAPATLPAPVVDEAPVVEDADDAKPAVSSAELVGYGIIGGIYLIYTIGWVALLIPALGGDIVNLAGVMHRVSQALAVLSPALWFGAAFVLGRGRRPRTRILVLVIGLVLALPWPILIQGV